MAARKRKARSQVERLVNIEFDTPRLFHDFKVLAASYPDRYGKPVPLAWEMPEDPTRFYQDLPAYKGRVILLTPAELADVRRRIAEGQDPYRPWLYE